MATRKKTIRIPINFGNVADLANNTNTTLGTQLIYIPENSVGNPVTFTSVALFIAAQDTSTATGGSIGTFTAGVTLSGVTVSSVAVATATLANSGENWGGLFGPIDYTSYFNTNFGTVTSKNATVALQVNISTGTGTTTRGAYAYFVITYTYSDTATTRIQTVCVPYEGLTTTLTTTANTTYCTIPQLTGAGGWLNGYASPVIRYRWLEIKGNCNNNAGTTNISLSFSFDSGGSTSLPQRIASLASDTYQIYQVDASGQSTTATHTFAIWAGTASRFSNLIVNEYITYEYTVLGTTSVLNYVELPVEFDSPTPGTTSSVALRWKRPLLIPEPDTLTMRACAVEIDYNTNQSATLNIKGGSQASYRSYNQSSSVVCGMFSFQHGLDSTSANGAAFTLARGENSLTLDIYRSVGGTYNTTGIFKLLYSSGVATAGVDSHSKTIYELTRAITFTTTADDTVTSKSFSFPETYYWIQSINYQYNYWVQSALSTLTTQVSVLAGEYETMGWRELFTDQFVGDNELSYGVWNVRARPEFKRYPQETDSEKLDLTSARSIRTTSSTAFIFGLSTVVAYHGVTSTFSGSIYNSNGGAISIHLHRVDTEEPFATTTVTGDTTYTFTVYDDTVSYYAVAYESTGSKGMSKEGVPAADFHINMSGIVGFGSG